MRPTPGSLKNLQNKGITMTCRGYDPKAIKISKLTKIAAARILDKHKRGVFIRGYVEIKESQATMSKNSKKKG
jgi:hypothetical protein